MMNINITPDLKRVAFIGNYLPRKCGIATFTSDLAEAFSEEFPGIQTMTLAMNDTEEGYAYPSQVRYEISQDEHFDYEHAAHFLNQQTVDIISLQHEYGIYGGLAGCHILTVLRNVTAPVVTTLHTILENPRPEQYRVMKEIIRLSNRLVVMSQRSIKLLTEVYGASAEKIDLIPHGIHDVPFVDPGFHKDKFGAEGKFVILTFGLLSANKGIEYVINALPEVVERYPNVLYVVLGSTHPHVILEEGEKYRESLQLRVKELGLEENVLFLDQFVNLKDLKEFIGAADIYITPYLGREQIVSGTLAYTVGAGKAVISTPYRYAEELLAEGRGLLVPFKDSKAITEKILYLLDNEAERNAIRKRAYLFGRDMIWPNVARSYLKSFEEARRQNISQLFAIPVTGFSSERIGTVPQLKLDHLKRMTDGTGMLQHSVYSVPNYNEGYTTDDNARALIVTVQLEHVPTLANAGNDEQLLLTGQELSRRYLAFLWHAFNPERKRFRNFMAYNRTWLEEVGSEDSHGRTLWALGMVLNKSTDSGLRGIAGRLFDAAISSVLTFTSPRGWAFSILGTERYLRRYPGDRAVLMVQDTLAQNLKDLYHKNHTEEWPWFEDVVSYCNPALPQALIRYGRVSGDEEAVEIGLDSLEWLVNVQQSEHGWTMPIGSMGFYHKGQEIPYFDQQPVEVYSLVSACLDAYRATKDITWYNSANQAFEWFFGRNALGMPVYDSQTGGCRDGLHIDRLNENQGAESTLSYLQALLELRQFGAEKLSQRRGKNEAISGQPASYLASHSHLAK
jgi:glycosyltransferase involved in cell wall biosynthesis